MRTEKSGSQAKQNKASTGEEVWKEVSEEMYRIRVKGHLDQQRSSYLGGLTIKHEIDGNSGETVLSGPIRDQAALFGVLLKIRDLGLPLLEVIRQSLADKPL